MRPTAREPVPLASAHGARRAGTLFVLGGLLFLLLTTAAESIYPNYSVQNNAMSDLAALGTSTTAIEETAVLGMGLCWMVGAYLLFYGRSGSRGLLAVNLLSSLGFVLAGLFPENVSIVFHSIGALLAFPFGATAAMLSYRVIRSALRYFALGLGALSLFATFIIFFGYRVIGPCGTCSYNVALDKLGLGLGGWEAMIVYPLLVWLIGFGGYLLNSQEA